jgi:CBS domain-containing protein
MEPIAIRHHIRMLKNSGAIEEWEYKRGKVGRPVIKYKTVQIPLSGQNLGTDALWFYDFFQRPLSTIVRKVLLEVNTDATILDAAEIMRDNNAGSIIVSDADKPVGIITESDLVNKVTARNILPLDIKVDKIMSKPVITIQVTAGIADAIEIMSKYRIRRLLALKEGEPFGIATQKSIIDAFVLESGIRAFKEKPVKVRSPVFSGSSLETSRE